LIGDLVIDWRLCDWGIEDYSEIAEVVGAAWNMDGFVDWQFAD
jgi:hypothetical protein